MSACAAVVKVSLRLALPTRRSEIHDGVASTQGTDLTSLPT